MLVALDHGNVSVKGSHTIFFNGLLESDNCPAFGEHILLYRDKYYVLSEKRLPFMRDKSVNEKFFILSLFAIAFEIEAAGAYSKERIMDVNLAIGLPPAHFGAQYERFEQYFDNRNVIDFKLNGKPYSIYINKVVCFPQAYAAAMPLLGQIQDISKIMVIDWGGMTLDYLQIRNGKADLSVCDSLEYGVIVLYNDIIKKINSELSLLLDEADIDTIIKGSSHDYCVCGRHPGERQRL